MADDIFAFAEQSDAAPPRRRRGWAWLVSAVIVAVLVVAAFLLGEWIARDLVRNAVRQQLVSQLALPADQQVAVDIPGSILWQLATGTIDDVTISSDDVTIRDISGDATVHLRNVQIRAGFAMSEGSATVSFDTDQLRALLTRVDGFPTETVGLAAPNVTMSTELSAFGVAVPVGVALTPSAADGDLVLSPASLQLGGATITADDLRSRFGDLADTVIRDWRVCVADSLPAGMPLQSVQVSGERLVVSFGVSGSIATDPAQRANGTCA